MGTWGTGIFDDDTTCDMRGHYRMALRAGVPGPEATDQILRDSAPGPDPFDTRVWLGQRWIGCRTRCDGECCGSR